ncbi:Probable GTP-binding protein EngB [Durusdinium trenchii]|uniref:Probable GTP-binding protein EngB n=1 Tax=Durusdinium trenchii TaxID=1381693 RepID=A0ABP0KKY0_9DINO
MQLAQGPTRRWREVSQVPPALHPCSGAGPSREPRRTRSRTTVALAAFTVALGSGTNRLRIQRRVRPERKEVVQAELAERKSKEVLPYAQPQEAIQWPNVLDPMKRQADLSLEREDGEMKRQNFQGKRERTVRALMQSFLRMQDPLRIIRFGIEHPEGDGRGWAAVALTRLNKTQEAAKLAAGPDGQTPCGYQTMRYVAHACAKEGAIEAAYHLSRLQQKCGRTKFITAGSRAFQSVVESSALYLQSTAEQMPKLLAGHGARVAEEIETLLEMKNEILALTPNRRFLMLNEPFNQLIRWYGRARLIPQALRACEIMNELGIPRNDMTLHFLSRGCAQQFTCLKKAKRYTQAPNDLPGYRPEVVFLGRVNSGKSSMINALFSSLTKFAPASKTRAFTRKLMFYEVNKERAGLPHFMMVDTPGLGCADIGRAASITRDWPDLIYDYLKNREALKHIFHLVDARNHKLLPGDKQLLHLVAKAQRRSVRYTIVITKIDVCKRAVANNTAQRIREELSPYCDVDIMFASARSLRGVDHMWSKIWQSVTETPRGRRHKDIGRKELERLRELGPDATKGPSLSELLEIPDYRNVQQPQSFDGEEWAEDNDYDMKVGERSEEYFDDKWGEELDDEGEGRTLDDFDDEAYEDEDDFSEDALERRWEDFDDDDDFEDSEVTKADARVSSPKE